MLSAVRGGSAGMRRNRLALRNANIRQSSSQALGCGWLLASVSGSLMLSLSTGNGTRTHLTDVVRRLRILYLVFALIGTYWAIPGRIAPHPSGCRPRPTSDADR